MNEKVAVATAKIESAQGKTRQPTLVAKPIERLDRYELERLLGKGGFSTVYAAYDPRIRRPVAVKRCSSLDEDDHERFFREAEIAGNLSHVNIVRIFDFGVSDGTPFIVQELLGGQDLADWIDSGLHLSNHDRARILLQVAQGLAYAHAHDVIHRDVKPANIRVLEDGSIKILDFGVAAIQDAPSHLTQDGMTVGTAAYLAPEQIRGESPDRATDIFSFGVVAYELLCGHRPFEGDTLSAVLYRVSHQEPDPLRRGSLPETLVDLVHKCLQKSKADRPQSFGEVIDQLEAALRDPRLRPPSAETIPIEPRAGGPRIQPRIQPRAQPSAQPQNGHRLEDLPLGGRTLPVRDSSIRIQTARTPRRPWKFLLAQAGLPAVIALYASVGGPLPGPAASAVAGAESWITGKLEEWSTLTTPVEPAPVPVGVPARRYPVQISTPEPAVTKPSQAPAGGDLDPVSAVIAELEAAKAPPENIESPKAKNRRVSPTARATVFLPPSWHPLMMVSVDGGAFRPLDSRQTRELAPGRHTLSFGLDTKTYSARKSLDILLDPAETRTIESPLAPPGALRFRIIPDNVSGEVEIDGRRSSLPLSQPVLIAPGPHTLVFHPFPDDPLGPLTKNSSLSPSSVHLVTFDMRRRRTQIEVVEPFEWNGE